MQMSFKQILLFLYHWFGNVALKLLKLKKREGTVWLFGAWRGEKYNDNPKYLFEYVCQNCPEITAVWITKKKTVKEELLKQGKKCYLSDEKEAKRIRLKAGFYFFTHGYHDFGDFDFGQGAVKVGLGHGMPLKKAYFATNFFQERNKSIVRRLQYLVMKIHNKAEQDITIASSEKTKKWLMECYETKPQNTLITGQPRNDILFNSKVAYQMKHQLHHKKEERFVLYMPTWRDTGGYGGFSSGGEASFLKHVLNQFLSDTAFMEKLVSEKVKFYIKPHPNRILSVPDQGNIKILHHHLHLDTQELMAAADVLITDYSSAFIDFALTDRPIHFYVPDLKEYEKGYSGIFLTFEELAEFWFKDIETFKKVIFNTEKYQQLGGINTEKINGIYDDQRLKRGTYCEHVVSSVRRFKNA